jgi:hypothetical protein
MHAMQPSKVLGECIILANFKNLKFRVLHPIHVVTSYGLGEIIGNRLAMGRITKWALELNITYAS